MDELRRIREVEKRAHQGAYGAWRRGFCAAYRALARQILQEAFTEARAYLAATGHSITCQPGCSYCCVHYISISVAHGLVIADYLCQHEAALRHFLAGYARWQRTLAAQPAAAAVLGRLEACTTLAPVVQRTSQELLTAYAALGVPCPFLRAGRCLIYAVRPLCCAMHYAVSPPACCREGSATPPLICEATPAPARFGELNALAEPALSLHQETLPSLVYDLLTQGLPEVLARVARRA